MRDNSVNLKLQDGMPLVDAVLKAPDQRIRPDFEWRFEATSFWHSVVSATQTPAD
ncbi:hypothetical protein N182_37270 [Sinorhizobium sp. GL2]|nr:hypothetical protein N182_37270 [Sinorhizobium sp. GL2]